MTISSLNAFFLTIKLNIEKRTALVANILARYRIGVAELNGRWLYDRVQLLNVSGGYAFFWSCLPYYVCYNYHRKRACQKGWIPREIECAKGLSVLDNNFMEIVTCRSSMPMYNYDEFPNGRLKFSENDACICYAPICFGKAKSVLFW